MLQHINSLRAFSVFIVVFYHFNIKYFEYGFLGVDIFLAISGYLISKIISEEINQTGKFDIFNFFLRRARRLFPVVIVLLLVSTFISYFLFYDARIFLNKSIIFNYSLIPNYFFWVKDINYFSENILNSNFLKHTWSLGLEYQFYIIFSLIFFLFIKRVKTLVFSLFVLSFFLDFYFITNKPSASFYLIPTRLWEFLLGAIFYFIFPVLKNIARKIKFLDLFSMLSIILTIFFFHDISLFFKKIIVVFFSCILITFYSSINTFKIILDNKHLNYVGLISFSLYLWHYLVFKLDSYFLWEIPIYILIFITFVLSIISYNVIEKPFRKKSLYNNISKKKFFIIIFLIGFIPILMQQKNIGLYKYNTITQKSFEMDKIGQKCINLNFNISDKYEKCLIGNLSKNNNDFILLGDSIAQNLSGAFDEYAKNNNIKGYFLGQSSCPPLIGINFLFEKKRKKLCEGFNKNIYKFVKKNNIKKIIIISNWENYITKPIINIENLQNIQNLSDEEKRSFNLKKSFEDIYSYSEDEGIQLIIFQQLPVLKYESARQIVYKEIELYKRINSNNVDKRFEKFLFEKGQFINYKKRSDQILNEVFKKKQLIDLTNFFCDIYCKVSDDEKSLYNDKIHFSKNGGSYFIKIFNKINFM